ncbi:hypothetical protein [Marinomonas colpomeniae]|nr:hypothetical protein [Marinomonas colpomeniae]
MAVFVKYKLILNRFFAVLICAFSLIILPVKAHMLNETSAQVILRDGQVEISIITDMVHLVATLQDNQAWLMGDISEVMPEGLSADQQELFIKKAFEEAVYVSVNQKKLTFERVVFKKTNHGHSTEIVLQARHSFANVTDVTASFPKSLGTVHASFVRPQYKVLNAGDDAHVVF